jgi:hypothetical protein
MTGIEPILMAAAFVSLSNFCMRRSIDQGGSSKAFLVVQLGVVCCVAILLNPVKSGNYAWSSAMALLGVAGGVVLGLMMTALGKALESGPPGLTFAALNASTVMPSIVMALLFGSAFGHHYTLWNGIGSIFVVVALFWAAWQTETSSKRKRWGFYVSGAFLLHVLFLVFLNWRALLMRFKEQKGLLLSFDELSAHSQWFMPMVFLAAFLFQLASYFRTEKRKPYPKEIGYGLLGGIANGIGTYFMIYATEVATSLEHAMIYPLFAVTTIILCNLWGQLLYQEKVNWKANLLAVTGILIGTVKWSVFF